MQASNLRSPACRARSRGAWLSTLAYPRNAQKRRERGREGHRAASRLPWRPRRSGPERKGPAPVWGRLGQTLQRLRTPTRAKPSPTPLDAQATRSRFEGLEGCSRYRTGSCRPRGRLAPQTAVAIDSQLDGRDDPDGPLPFGNDGNPLDRWMVTRIVKRRRLTPALPRRRWCYAPGPRMTFAVAVRLGCWPAICPHGRPYGQLR